MLTLLPQPAEVVRNLTESKKLLAEARQDLKVCEDDRPVIKLTGVVSGHERTIANAAEAYVFPIAGLL